MPVIDTHVRVAAWLHIVQGALAVCVIGCIGLIVGFTGVAAGSAVHGRDATIVAWLASLGAVLFAVILAFPLLEIVGGVMLLGGSVAGRIITLIFSVLGLISIPIGTAIGIYSLWALLREAPAAPADAGVVQSGMRST